jgi:hypothetical protein
MRLRGGGMTRVTLREAQILERMIGVEGLDHRQRGRSPSLGFRGHHPQET